MKRTVLAAAVAATLGIVLGGALAWVYTARRGPGRRARQAVAATAPLPAETPLVRRLTAPAGQANDLCPNLWDTPMGPFWFAEENPRGLELTVKEQMAGIYERPEIKVRPGDVVLDVGAYVGTFTRVALNRGAAQVWAIEPNAASAACLAKTFADEIRAGKVHVLPLAIWSAQGHLSFRRQGIQFRVAEAPKAGRARAAAPGPAAPAAVDEIPATTIDALVAEHGIGRVDFIKMDIEGSEREALKGAVQVIAQQGPEIAIAIYHDFTRASRIVPDWAIIPHLILQARPSYHVRANETHQEAYFFDPSARAVRKALDPHVSPR